MTDVILEFTPAATLRRAKTLRELARARWVEAVRELEMGDSDRYLEFLRDVDAFVEEARRIERHAERVEDARRATSEALAMLIRKVSA